MTNRNLYQKVKKGIRKVLLSGLTGLALSGCNDGLNNHPNRQISVYPGELEYSNGTELKSEGFATCSVLILDYRNSAVMGHAIRVNDDDNLIDEGKVVDAATKKLEDEGINPIESEAIVDAGSKSSYDKILADLNKRRIKIRSASYALDSAPRVVDISYNPVNNRLIVRKIGNSQ